MKARKCAALTVQLLPCISFKAPVDMLQCTSGKIGHRTASSLYMCSYNVLTCKTKKKKMFMRLHCEIEVGKGVYEILWKYGTNGVAKYSKIELMTPQVVWDKWPEWPEIYRHGRIAKEHSVQRKGASKVTDLDPVIILARRVTAVEHLIDFDFDCAEPREPRLTANSTVETCKSNYRGQGAWLEAIVDK